MRRRSRFRRIAKWTGVVVCAPIGIAWIASQFVRVEWSSRSYWGIYLEGGEVQAGNTTALSFTYDVDFGWYVSTHEHRLFTRWPSFGLPWMEQTAAWYVTLPLWIPFLIIAIPTTVLFNQDHRRLLLGHCKCGYDLTGNLSGRCPECGKGVA